VAGFAFRHGVHGQAARVPCGGFKGRYIDFHGSFGWTASKAVRGGEGKRATPKNMS
jgi:hypothetical protein